MIAALSLLRALSLAPLRARARRSVLAVVAIAVGVALGLAVNLVNDAALAEMQQAFRTLSGDADVRIEGAARTIDENLYGKIGLHPDVDTIAPIIELDAGVAGKRETLKIIGLDPFASAHFTPHLIARPDEKARDPLANFGGRRIAVSPAVMNWLQAGAVSTDVLLSTPNGPRTLAIAGVLAGVDSLQRIAVLDIDAAQELFNLQGQITRLELRLAPGVDRAAFIKQIAATLPSGVRAVALEVREQQAAAMSRAYRVNLTMLAMIALFSGALLVFSTQMLSVAERGSELAFLRVLGVTRCGVVALMLFEALLLGAMGALLGAALGYALAWGALQMLGGDLGAGFFYGTRPALSFAPAITTLFVLLGATAALLGAWIPALTAARAHPAQALKTGTLYDNTGTGPRSAIGATLCAASALLALAPAIKGIPVFGYIAISGMLIGAILLTPAICASVFRFAARHTETLAATSRLAITRLANAPAQAGISLAAIIAAVSLAGAMAIMVTSFRISVEHWLEQVLPSPAYLRQKSSVQNQSQGYFDAAAQVAIRATPGITRAEFVRTEMLTLDPARPPVGLVIREFGDSAKEQPDKRLPLVKRYSTAGDTTPLAWVSESFLDLYHESLQLDHDNGGTFDLPLPMNAKGVATLRVQVAGVWRDYSRQHGSVVMQLPDYTRATGDARAYDAALWLREGVTAAALLPALETRLPDIAALDLTETADVRALTLSIFDRTFAVTYALEAVAVLIGLAGMAAAFTGLIVARRKEFGMLRHLGLTRRELTRMLTLEGAALAALGALLGVALGVILAVILVFVINPQSFGWSMDFHLPVLQLGAFAATLIAAATFSAWLTARCVIGTGSTNSVVLSVREDW